MLPPPKKKVDELIFRFPLLPLIKAPLSSPKKKLDELITILLLLPLIN